LFANIRDQRNWIASLTPAEMGMVLKRFCENSGDTVCLFCASAMHLVGKGVVAVHANNGAQTSAYL
jgi:hypothetical protein